MKQARQSGLFEKIHLSTDSQKMIGIAEKNGFSIDFIRPKEYATDHAQLNDVVGYVIKKFEEQKNIYDNICLIWPTSPLKETSDIIKSYRLLTNKCSSVLGVTDYQISIFSAFFANVEYLEPVHPDMLREKSVKQPRVVCCNSSVCWFKVNEYKSQGHWLMQKTTPYYMPKHKSVDIDDEDDWRLANTLLKIYGGKNK